MRLRLTREAAPRPRRKSAAVSSTVRSDAAAVPPGAYAVLGIAQLAIGAAAIFARYALHDCGPIAVSALRLGIVGLPFAIVAMARRVPRYGRRTELLLAAAGVALAIHFATWIGSLAYTDVATSTLLVTTAPIWLSLYERFIRHRRLPPRYPAILALAIAGLIAIVGAPGGGGSAPILGDILALTGAFAIAAYLEIIRTLNLPSTFGVVARTYPISALVLVPFALVAHQGPPPLDARLSWFGILAMALISQGIGHTGMNAATRYFSSRFVATSTLLEPVIAGILAVILFRERLSIIALIGCAVIFVAIVLAVRAEGKTLG